MSGLAATLRVRVAIPLGEVEVDLAIVVLLQIRADDLRPARCVAVYPSRWVPVRCVEQREKALDRALYAGAEAGEILARSAGAA